MPQRQKLTDEEILTVTSRLVSFTIYDLLVWLSARPGGPPDGLSYSYVERRLRELERRRLVRRAGNSESDRRRRLWVAV